MVKTHNRIIAGALSTLLIGQIALFGDGTGKGILHPDTIAYAAESIKEKKNEKELADEFEKAVSELGQVDYFDVTDSSGRRKLRNARSQTSESNPMDDISDSLTVSGIVSLGEVAGHTRNDDPPIYVRIYTGDWQELTHQTIHNGDSYNVSIEGGYSDVYHVKYECDGYLPFYLKDYGTGSFVVGSNGSHNTVTLVPGDTTYNTESSNQWRHAERIIADELKNMGVHGSNVTRIYSELQPCITRNGSCRKYIQNNFPNALVSYSFEYGDALSRRRGVAALGKAISSIWKKDEF